MDDQGERMKNKKKRIFKMFPSDIILKFKNIVKLNSDKLLKLRKIFLLQNNPAFRLPPTLKL